MEWNNAIHVLIIETWVQIHIYVTNVRIVQIQFGTTLYVRQLHAI